MKIREATILSNFYVTFNSKGVDNVINGMYWIKSEEDLKDRTFRICLKVKPNDKSQEQSQSNNWDLIRHVHFGPLSKTSFTKVHLEHLRNLPKLRDDLLDSMIFDPGRLNLGDKSERSVSSYQSDERDFPYKAVKLNSHHSNLDVVTGISETILDRTTVSSFKSNEPLQIDRTLELLKNRLVQERLSKDLNSPASPSSGIMYKRKRFKAKQCFSDGNIHNSEVMQSVDFVLLGRNICNYENGKLKLMFLYKSLKLI